jgi:hypothetical protein
MLLISTPAAPGGSRTEVYDIMVGEPGGFPMEGAPAYLRGGDCTSIVSDKPIWYLGLGRMRNGEAAGSIGFRQGDFSGSIFTPHALYYTAPDPAEVEVILAGTAIRQVFSREVLVDVVTLTSTSYRLDVFARSDVGPKSGGLYQKNPGAEPFVSYTIEKITDPAEGIKITRAEDGQSWVTSLVGDATSRTFMDWKLSSETKKAWIKTEYTSATTATVTHAGPDSTGGNTESPLSYTKSYTDFTTIDATWGKELSNTTLGQSTDVPLVSQWSYYTTTSTADGSFARSLKTEIDPAGTWKKYEYYATDSSSGPAGSIKRIYRSWLDGPASPDEAHADNSVTEDWTYYSNGTNYYWNLPASVTAKAPNGATLSQTVWRLIHLPRQGKEVFLNLRQKLTRDSKGRCRPRSIKHARG